LLKTESGRRFPNALSAPKSSAIFPKIRIRRGKGRAIFREARIYELEEMLKQVSIIKKAAGVNEVHIGSTVTADKDNASAYLQLSAPTSQGPNKIKFPTNLRLARLFGKEGWRQREREYPGGPRFIKLSA